MLGISPIMQNKETVALMIAAERFAALFFANGAQEASSFQSLITLQAVAKENAMNLPNNRKLWTGVALAAMTVALGSAYAQQGPRGRSSYAPVEITEPFSSILARLSAQKPAVEREHMAVLNERYDLLISP